MVTDKDNSLVHVMRTENLRTMFFRLAVDRLSFYDPLVRVNDAGEVIAGLQNVS